MNLYEKIKILDLKFKGQVLIFYNENVEYLVINQIYPNITTSKITVRQSVKDLWDTRNKTI